MVEESRIEKGNQWGVKTNLVQDMIFNKQHDDTTWSQINSNKSKCWWIFFWSNLWPNHTWPFIYMISEEGIVMVLWVWSGEIRIGAGSRNGQQDGREEYDWDNFFIFFPFFIAFAWMNIIMLFTISPNFPHLLLNKEPHFFNTMSFSIKNVAEFCCAKMTVIQIEQL